MFKDLMNDDNEKLTVKIRGILLLVVLVFIGFIVLRFFLF